MKSFMSMQLRLSLTLATIALSLAGCAHLPFKKPHHFVSLDNSSLDYKKAKLIAPLNVPSDLQLQPQQALYPAPQIDPLALEQAPNFANYKGNRYALPRPKTASVAQDTISTGSAPTQPQLVQGGNGVTVLKIDGATDQVWKYVKASLSSSNVKMTDIKNSLATTIDYQGQQYTLRLSPNGNSNILAVYNSKNGFADVTIATEILNQIVQSWPA